jgi:hypothetical protein
MVNRFATAAVTAAVTAAHRMRYPQSIRETWLAGRSVGLIVAKRNIMLYGG